MSACGVFDLDVDVRRSLLDVVSDDILLHHRPPILQANKYEVGAVVDRFAAKESKLHGIIDHDMTWINVYCFNVSRKAKTFSVHKCTDDHGSETDTAEFLQSCMEFIALN